VKLDDIGYYLSKRENDGLQGRMARGLGRGILTFAPWFMKLLSIAGTAAMFLVGGGILAHGLPFIHHWVEARVEGASGLVSSLLPMLTGALVGVLAGAITLLLVSLLRKLWPGGKEESGPAGGAH
jgi:predicted DNA repair protein MutK